MKTADQTEFWKTNADDQKMREKVMRSYKLMMVLSGFTLALAVTATYPNAANANPAFARKFSQPCSSCHFAFPLLKSTGRIFKENGFKFSRADEPGNVISDFLKLDENFPVSAIVKSRPYDKPRSGNHTIRALHEVELVVSGLVAKDISVFFEYEAEDEDGFNAQIASAYLSYHPLQFFNIAFAYAPVFGLDPYDTLSSRRLNRGRSQIIAQAFEGADNGRRLRDSRQLIYVYGRPLKQVYYSFGIGGVGRDTEGVNANVKSGRVAVDVLPNLMIGAFGMSGQCKITAAACARDRDFGRYGVDTQLDFRNFRFQGAYVRATGDRATSGEERNYAWYLQGFYAIQRDDRPWIVPSLRFDKYTNSNGSAKFDELTLNITYFLYENVKVFLEGFQQVRTPNGTPHNGRITLQAEIGF